MGFSGGDGAFGKTVDSAAEAGWPAAASGFAASGFEPLSESCKGGNGFGQLRESSEGASEAAWPLSSATAFAPLPADNIGLNASSAPSFTKAQNAAEAAARSRSDALET